MDFENFKEMVESAYTDIIMTGSVPNPVAFHIFPDIEKSRENAGVCKMMGLVKDSKGLDDFLIGLKLLVHGMTVDMNALILPASYKKPIEMIEAQGYSFFICLINVLEAPYTELPLLLDSKYDLVNTVIEYRLKEGL